MAVPISATNSTRRSLSGRQNSLPVRAGQRKMSDSFFASIFSTRPVHRKATSVEEPISHRSASAIDPPRLHDISGAPNTSVAAKPPTGIRRVIPSGEWPLQKTSNYGNAVAFDHNYNSVLKKMSTSSKSLSVEIPPPKFKAPDDINGEAITQRPQSRSGSAIRAFFRRSLSRSKSKQQEDNLKSQGTKINTLLIGPDRKAPLETMPTQLTFAQHIKLHKGIRSGNVPVKFLNQKLLLQKNQQAIRQQKWGTKNKHNNLPRSDTSKILSPLKDIDDTTYLTEALFALADLQPVVARSTPKIDHTNRNLQRRGKGITTNADNIRCKRKADERLRRDCILRPEVYDKMLAESLDVCAELQAHLVGCINGVRAHSPTVLSTPFSSPPTTPLMVVRSQTVQSHLHAGTSYQTEFPSFSSHTASPHVTERVLHDATNKNFRNNLKTPPLSEPSQRKQRYSYYTGMGAANTPRPGLPIRPTSFQDVDRNHSNNLDNNKLLLYNIQSQSTKNIQLPIEQNSKNLPRRKYTTNVHFAT